MAPEKGAIRSLVLEGLWDPSGPHCWPLFGSVLGSAWGPFGVHFEGLLSLSLSLALSLFLSPSLSLSLSLCLFLFLSLSLSLSVFVLYSLFVQRS